MLTDEILFFDTILSSWTRRHTVGGLGCGRRPGCLCIDYEPYRD